MVNREIMRADSLYKFRDQTKLIKDEYFDQFVATVLTWYQQEVEHPTFFVENITRPEVTPPNLFHLFEYPNDHVSEYVIKHFLYSDVAVDMESTKAEDKEALNRAIQEFNAHYDNRYPNMLHDVSMILNGYRLFYCYGEDTRRFKPKFFNAYVKEVW